MIEVRGNQSAELLQVLQGDQLPADFLTGNLVVDTEHQRLYALLRSAHHICIDMDGYRDCSGCLRSRRGHCDGSLLKLLGDLLSFSLDHFRTEEGLMRDSLLIMVDRLQCEEHIEDHAAMSSRIERIIAALDDRHTVELLREVNEVLANWVMTHIRTHDVRLVSWIEREDSALRSGI